MMFYLSIIMILGVRTIKYFTGKVLNKKSDFIQNEVSGKSSEKAFEKGELVRILRVEGKKALSQEFTPSSSRRAC